MPNDTISKLQDYKTNLISKAELLVTNGFPEKIVELNQLLETSLFNEPNFDGVQQEVNILLAATGDGAGDGPEQQHATPLPCNEPICDMIKAIKPIMVQVIKDSNLVKVWILYLMPKIEDGNNFGVSIQKETVSSIQLIEIEATEFFDQIYNYFMLRGKIVSKVTKYPGNEDYLRSVSELDEKQRLNLRIAVCDIRDRYSSLHDIITKNMEILKQPRASETESFY